MEKRFTKILFLAIVILTLGVRLIGLDRCFVLDEYKTISYCRLSVDELFQKIETEGYSPFSYLTLRAWMHISQSDIWIRFLFVLFGISSVIIIYLIGKELINSEYAVIAAFLASLMPMQVWVSQYVRGISPAIFFLLLSTLFFLRLIKNKKYNLNAAGYVASTIMAIYSFYFAFFIIAVQNVIYIALHWNKIKSIFKWFLLQVTLFILFLPWFATGFLKQMRDANIVANFVTIASTGFNVGRLQIGSYIRATSGLLGLDEAFLVNIPLTKILTRNLLFFISIIFLFAIIYLIYLLIKIYRITAKKEIVIFFLAFSLTPLILLIKLNILLKTPIVPRYMAVSSIFLIFIYALILFSIRNKKLFYSVLAIFVIISFVRLADFTKTSIDYKSAATFINDNIKSDECLLFVGGFSSYKHYSPMPRHYIILKDYVRKYKIGSDYSLDYLVDEKALQAKLNPFEVVWIYNSGQQMIGIVEYVLNLIEVYGYEKVGEYQFKNLKIFKYAKGA